MSAARPSIALPGAIAAAALSFGICFAVVASPTGTSPPRVAPARPMREVARTSLTLHAVPALRVRAAVLHGARVPWTRAAPPARPQQPPAPAMSAPVERSATPVSTTTPSTPPPRSAPTVRPKPVAAPKRAPAVKFDQAGPQPKPAGFDTSG